MVCLEHCTEDKTCQLEQLKIYEDSNDEMNEDNETDYAEMVAEVLTGRLSPFQQLAVGKVTAAAQQGLPADNSNDTDEEAEGNSNDDIDNMVKQNSGSMTRLERSSPKGYMTWIGRSLGSGSPPAPRSYMTRLGRSSDSVSAPRSYMTRLGRSSTKGSMTRIGRSSGGVSAPRGYMTRIGRSSDNVSAPRGYMTRIGRSSDNVMAPRSYMTRLGRTAPKASAMMTRLGKRGMTTEERYDWPNSVELVGGENDEERGREGLPRSASTLEIMSK